MAKRRGNAKQPIDGNARKGKPAPLTIAQAVRKASAQVLPDESDDRYLRNASIAARALSLLFPDEEIDEDDVEFGVSFEWPNVPSPVALVKAYLEENDLSAPGTGDVISARRGPAPDMAEEFSFDAKDFVFAEMLGDVVFLPRSIAQEWARFQREYWRCDTWGELRKQVSAALYHQALEHLGEERVSPGRSLDEDRDALLKEEFPPAAWTLMRWHLPSELEVLIETETNMLGEELHSIPVNRQGEALAIFERLGVSCVEDAALVHAAVGFRVPP